MGRAGRRAPRHSPGLPEAKRRGRARRMNKEEELEAGLQRLELGAEGPVATGTGLVYAEPAAAACCPRDESAPQGPAPLAAVWAKLQEFGLVERCVRVEPRLATDEELLLVHSPEAPALTQTTAEGSSAAAAFPSPATAAGGARLAAGALLALVTKVVAGELRNGLALARTPGPQAQRDAPDADAVAVAARFAQRRLGARRVLLVDWDVRPGRGTQCLFEDDPSVLCFSVHRGEGGPPGSPPTASGCGTVGRGRAEGFTINLPWDQPGMTDGDYLAAFLRLLLPVALEFQPQLVLVAAGFGALVGDPQGGMSVTPGCFAHLTHLLMALAGGRLVLSLEGGWEPRGLAQGLGAVLGTLLGDPCPPSAPAVPSASGLASLARAIDAHRKYWGCLRQAEPQGPPAEEGDEGQGAPGAPPAPPPEPPEEALARAERDVTRPRPPARTGLLYDERMTEHYNMWDSQHPEVPQRVTRIMERLAELGLAERCLRLPPREALPHELHAVHTPAYVAGLAATAGLGPRELRRAAARFPSVFLCARSAACARLAAGAACAAVAAVLGAQVRNAVAVVRPPGHHAEPDAAGGFCLLNSAAVAARHGQRLAGGRLRVLIVDWDVHHGNGTQRIFEDDPSVLYVSLHRHDGAFFPGGGAGGGARTGRGRGRGFTLNVGWAGPRAADGDYLAAMERLVLPVAYQFAPELVLVSAGFDAARGDPLGGCQVSPEAFGLMTHLLAGLAGGRLVLILEGGYNLGATAEGVAQCTRVLLGDPPPAPPPPAPPQPGPLRALELTRGAHWAAWACLRLPPRPPAPPAEEEPPEEQGSAGDTPCDDITHDDDITGGHDIAPGDNTPRDSDLTPRDELTPRDDIMRLGELRLGDPPGPAPPEGGASTQPGAGLPPADHAPQDPPGLLEEAAGPLPSPTGLEEELAEGLLFAVAPLRGCPHVGAVAPVPGGGLAAAPPCEACGSRREPWLCLSCYRVLCGRYVGGHMLEHGSASGHALVLSYSDLSAWCYSCQSYVHHPALLPAKTLLHRLKFGVDPPDLPALTPPPIS